VEHLIAIASLGLACVLWWLVQRWAAAGRTEALDGPAEGGGCGACATKDSCSQERPLPAPHRGHTGCG
jgi:hypothetical protein